MKALLQKTLASEVKTTGIGLHSGRKVILTLKPAPINTGVIYRRTDVDEQLDIKTNAQAVVDTRMATTLAHPENSQARVLTIEHLMSALAGLGVDNVIVEVNAPEIPIMDGSATSFVYLIGSVGLVEQNAPRQFIRILQSVSVIEGDKWARLDPYFGFKARFNIDFNHPAIDQTGSEYELDFEGDAFVKHISRARTFGFIQDVEALRGLGLAQGGSLSNAIVMDEYKILNPEGLRYSDEFVKHKILDAIGDLYVIGHPVLAAYSAYKSGHALNNQLIRAVLADEANYEMVTFENAADAPNFAQPSKQAGAWI
ncbi:UDP-3-O-acyl-N-acetylglucosamine deacetylase [Hydromonas duriensis]|uniref:UDP-3-O-acyl-N-acetylglucosamine deacetylase n=1 Tax=Hydromonas duriensis TaxID=1527608 RepID=A0A4R6Y613_9BURK|nr:UDP-3-O-acyl-N-acetylglucosamine deacetylase [Hydromonas duriensis]TDR30843.1 UDP-3-O-[3-hydroxymyristoyl] N-acetylglucosamine deacetylase [Hydromonas duriensis]